MKTVLTVPQRHPANKPLGRCEAGCCLCSPLVVVWCTQVTCLNLKVLSQLWAIPNTSRFCYRKPLLILARCQQPAPSEHWCDPPRSPKKEKRYLKNHCFPLVMTPIFALEKTPGVTSLALYGFCHVKPLLFLQIDQRPLSIAL